MGGTFKQLLKKQGPQKTHHSKKTWERFFTMGVFALQRRAVMHDWIFFSWAVEASLLGCRAGFPINDPLRICFRHQIFWQINLLISWTRQTKTTWKNIVQGRYPYEAFVPRPKLLTCLRWFSRNRARQIKYLLRNLWDIVRPWQSLATLFARPNHDSSSKQWKQKGFIFHFPVCSPVWYKKCALGLILNRLAFTTPWFIAKYWYALKWFWIHCWNSSASSLVRRRFPFSQISTARCIIQTQKATFRITESWGLRKLGKSLQRLWGKQTYYQWLLGRWLHAYALAFWGPKICLMPKKTRQTPTAWCNISWCYVALLFYRLDRTRLWNVKSFFMK